MSEFAEQMTTLNAEIMQLHDSVEMSYMLLEEVVERTQNFREGYYSHKKVSELARGITKQFRVQVDAAQDEDDLLNAFRESIQGMRNLTATVMTEIDRLEK